MSPVSYSTARLCTMAVADRPTRVAFAASLLLHASLVAMWVIHPRVGHSPLTSDVWGGDTLELDGLWPSGGHDSENRSAITSPAPAPVERADLAGRTTPDMPALTGEHAHHRERPMSSAVAASSEGESGTPGAGGSAGMGQTQGTQDAEASVRNLAKAFTRAIPFGTRADPIWTTLPLGPVGEMTVEFELEDDGHIARAEPKERDVVPALRHLLERTLILLKMGRFAPESTGHAGHEVLRVQARLDRAPADSTYSDSEQAMSLDYEPPTLERPGRAAFQLGTGRRLEVRVAIVNGDAPQ